MGLIERIKSALGLGTSTSNSQPAPSSTDGPPPGDGVDVTREYEPDTASEDAVKGTDTAGSESTTGAESGADTGPESSAGSAESDAGASTETDAASAEADTATDEAASDEPATDDQSDGEPASAEASSDAELEDIKGIGPAYAGRLRDAGVDGVADLAESDPAELAEATDIAASRIEDWVEQAKFY